MGVVGSFLVFLNVCFVFVFLEGDGMLFCCWRFFGAALKKGKQVLFWCIWRRKKGIGILGGKFLAGFSMNVKV